MQFGLKLGRKVDIYLRRITRRRREKTDAEAKGPHVDNGPWMVSALSSQAFQVKGFESLA